MNPILRNILALIAGFVIGSIVNMGIIMLSGSIIPPPDGVNPADVESLKANIHLFQPKHFIFPFLAHALGTLAGAFTAAKLAAKHSMKLAFGIGVFFLLGGLMMIQMVPAPTWFNILDAVVAYIPMGWLGGKLAGKF